MYILEQLKVYIFRTLYISFSFPHLLNKNPWHYKAAKRINPNCITYSIC